jgi:hypothetical protein
VSFCLGNYIVHSNVLKGVMVSACGSRYAILKRNFVALVSFNFTLEWPFHLCLKQNRSRWCTTLSPTSKKAIFEEMQITCLGGRIGGFEHYACGTPKPEQLCHQTSTWFGSIRKKEKFHHIHSKPKCIIAYKAILIFVLNFVLDTILMSLVVEEECKVVEILCTCHVCG